MNSDKYLFKIFRNFEKLEIFNIKNYKKSINDI